MSISASKASANQSQSKKPQKRSNQMQQQQSAFQQPTKKSQYSLSKSPFMSEGQKINFQSEDSEGSDISYQSSIQSEDDINIGQIEYFKEEMGRFFINYPELINDGILHGDDSQEEADQQFGRGNSFGMKNSSGNAFYSTAFGQSEKPQTTNKNWSLIADQILNQAKESCSFLQSLSRRIALYRSKIYQEDLIDVLLKQEKNILKQIELQISLKKKQNKGTKNTMMEHAQGCQNVYFSWRKKKEIENKINLHKEENPIEKNQNNKNNQANEGTYSPKGKEKNPRTLRNRTNTLSSKKMSTQTPKSLNKKTVESSNTKMGSFFLTSNDVPSNGAYQTKQPSKTNYRSGERHDSRVIGSNSPISTANKRQYSSLGKTKETDKQKTIFEEGEKEVRNFPSSGQSQTFWKHLVNFEPRTEAGRQLCELIRKTNNPNDELGIKKTIMQYLARNRETVQNEIILKSTISQKIQKLYNDDSKELLMFYPTKMTTGQGSFGQNKEEIGSNNANRQSALIANSLGSNITVFGGEGDGTKGSGQGNMYQASNGENGLDVGNKLFDEGEKFMHLLEDIVEGPLMKYWMMLQENKL